MADNVVLNSGTGGATLATDDVGGIHYQIVKVAYGALDAATIVSDSNPLPIDDAGGSLTVDGTVTADAGTGPWPVTDNGGALTIDHATLDNAHSADFDTGAGADTTPAYGIAVPAAGGAAVVPGDATAGLKVDLGADNDVTVTGSVTANAGTNLNTSALALESGGNLATVAGAVAGTEMQVDVVAALPAGTNNIGDVDIASALPAGDNNIGNVDLASAIPAGTNNIGDVDVASIAAGASLIGDVGLSGARTSGGTTLHKNIDVDESEDAVKASAGQIYWIHAINLANAPRYLKLYNATVATVIVGTTVPDLTFPIPSQGDTNGAGFTLTVPNGIAFSTAITIAATTGLADNDSGAPGANEVVVNLGYA